MKGNGLDAALPEEQERVCGVIPESQTWLLKELEGRIRALEEKLVSQENGILKISKRLEAVNGHRDKRDKIIIRLFKMLNNNVDWRSRLMRQIIEIQKKEPTRRAPKPFRKEESTGSNTLCVEHE